VVSESGVERPLRIMGGGAADDPPASCIRRKRACNTSTLLRLQVVLNDCVAARLSDACFLLRAAAGRR